MKAAVNKDLCTGCGLCVDTCPEVFHLEDDVAAVQMDPVPPEEEAACREAAEGCPVDAITIQE
ncbi:MAG: ferredoxin [Lentisphaerae bacterium RIFOXYB12_FULL_65_16]|nr:MAG: ferredoxin [Lentisphaerae bacterium RIFOXYA12_64_32]OGV85755.1 MAG: ferredoxin [Lentisphaerae bacterium RIFOXYB12_FULL_65_16]